MRWAACSVVALAGCNAVFGLNDNAKVATTDAPIFPDGKLDTFTLKLLLADTKQEAAGMLNEPAMITTVGIAGISDVKVGPVGGELFDANYIESSGVVEIPIANINAGEWRVRYTLGGVVHEVIWKPESFADARLVEPAMGRLEIVPPPADSGYNIQPTGTGTPPVGGYNKSRVFTTGAFLDIRTGATPSTTTVSSSANTSFGPINSPDASQGDVAVLVNYDNSGGCQRANGFGAFTPPPLVEATKVVVNPAWVTTLNGALTASNPNQGMPATRLKLGLGDRTNLSTAVVEHGITLSTEIPGTLIDRPVTVGATEFRVPGPHMLMLAQCNLGTTAFPPFVLPTDLAQFPRVTHGMIIDSRMVGATTLTSSVIGASAMTGTSTTAIDMRAPIAIAPITLATADGSSTFDLSSNSDTESVFFASSPATLTFAVEVDQAGLTVEAHQFEVTLFAIDPGGPLIKKRVFVSTKTAFPTDPPRVIESPIPVDLSGLPSGKYVFQIRSIFGTPSAANGNFESIVYPYSAASVFTRAFDI